MKQYIPDLSFRIVEKFMILTWILLFQTVPAFGVEDLEAIHASARKWIDIRLQTSQLESDWSWQKDLLESTRDALKFRIQQAKQEEALLNSQMASAKKAIQQKQEQVGQLRDELDSLEQHNQSIINEIKSLKAYLPPTLSDSLDLAFISLSDPDLSIGEKMQLVVTVLNRCTQFNDKITYSEVIVRNGTNGKEQLLSVLYWGLSHAYALNKETGDTFLGKPTGNGWEWIPHDGMESEINKLIQVFNDESDPQLVRAPIHVNMSEPR